MSLICTIYLWREWEEPRSESMLEFFERKEDLAWVVQDFPFHPSFPSLKTKTFHSLTLSFSTQSILLQTSKLFTHQTPMRPTHLLWIAYTHFHRKLMKNISSSIETCFFMILHENLNLWIHVQNSSFWLKFHLLHMKLVVWPACQVCEF